MKEDEEITSPCQFEPELSEGMVCDESYRERKELLDEIRSQISEIGPEAVTSGIRFGIILVLLKMESACGCEFQYALNESRQPLISHHLSELKNLGWLQSERWKKWIFYSLTEEKKELLLTLLCDE